MPYKRIELVLDEPTVHHAPHTVARYGYDAVTTTSAWTCGTPDPERQHLPPCFAYDPLTSEIFTVGRVNP